MANMPGILQQYEESTAYIVNTPLDTLFSLYSTLLEIVPSLCLLLGLRGRGKDQILYTVFVDFEYHE
jgi:hypothetical protein